MGIILFLLVLLCFCITSTSTSSNYNQNGNGKREIIDVKGGPDDVVWIVQLSDLHFSVHHPERALDFKNFVGPALSMIKPSLVFITGDLTDGKSKDLLTMKQDQMEWMEYKTVMEDVVERSGLSKNIFYDLRGNHDNFGVPVSNGSSDFFSTYSLNGQLGRRGTVNSVTIQTGERKLLFVGIDSTMAVGLRGPTNFFGHLTDQLLTEINSELSQWDSQSTKLITKISFGHFPLSFSAASHSGKTLKDTFLNNSVSAYVCGHLHTKFGKNLKRHHEKGHHFMSSQKYYQLNAHESSSGAPPVEEFWEWEMGDWRTSRSIRILAIDRGLISFIDTNFKSGDIKTIILPTFPLDSRFTLTMNPSSYETIRSLVFSSSPIVSVVVKIYDSRPGNLYVVMEASMKSKGDLYTAPWSFKAFEDPSPDRYWLQIEAIDINGKSTLTELRPFSVNGIRGKLSWTWKEFLVMGCQWDALYGPILWSFYLFSFSILIIPKAILTLSNKQYTYKNFIAKKSFINGILWVCTELYRVPLVFWSMLVYLFYLILCPWLFGQIFTDGGERGYMTYKGWVLKLNTVGRLDFLGFPDVMVVVLPHLIFVVLPTILVTLALAAERGMYQDHLLSLSKKKKDDYVFENNGSTFSGYSRNKVSVSYLGKRWLRNILLVISLAIYWRHFKNCRLLMKAYEMNPFVHFPLYSFVIPLILAYTAYKTRRV